MIITNQLKKSSPKHTSSQNHYHCACGFATNIDLNYKIHVQEEHQGRTQDNSSHFIAHLTELILPNPLINKLYGQFILFSDSQDQDTNVQVEKDENMEEGKIKRVGIPKVKKLINEEPEQKIKRGRGRPKRKKTITEEPIIRTFQQDCNQNIVQTDQNTNYQFKTDELNTLPYESQHKITQIKRQTTLDQHKNIFSSDQQKQFQQQQSRQLDLEWNGFKLIKNHKINTKYYCCGQCNLTCQDIQSFIAHCIEQCQELKHPASSHFIKISSQPQTLYQSQQLYIQKPISNEKRRRKTRQKSRISYNQQSIFQNINNRQFQRSDQMAFLLNAKISQKDQYFCSCNKVFKTQFQYKQHIKYTVPHSQIINSKCSHIFLRYYQFISKKYYQFIKISCNQDTEKVYYCPCNVDLKINLKELIKHTLQVHKGISPFYHLKDHHHERRKYKKNVK